MTLTLALDCGGSTSVAAVVESGRVIERVDLPGANLYSHGAEAIAAVVQQAMDRLPGVEAIVVAAAGVRGAEDQDRVIEALREAGIDLPLAVYPDTRAALRAAGIRQGVVLVAGTGSAAIAVGPRGEARVGGWGSVLGDEGSGAWLGLRMVRAVVRAADEGRDLPALRSAILDQLTLASVQDLRRLASSPPAVFASLAPILGQLLVAGDPIAAELVHEAVEELARLVILAASGADLARPVSVVLVGGLTRAIDVLPALLEDRLGNGYVVGGPEEEPVMGAYHLAMEDADWDTGTASSVSSTEAVNPASEGIDQRSTVEMLRIMNAEDARVASVVAGQIATITRLVDAAATRLRAGGRLIYVGAGTSGRLAMLDAAECVPTFGTARDRVIAIIAGGQEALTRAVEGAEDDGPAGERAIGDIDVTPMDVVVGISASGRAAFVRHAVQAARHRGAYTGFVTCGRCSAAADVIVSVPVGPEVISGSTRLKAGTAQKLVLNMVSTGVMIRLGRTLGNRMIKVRPTNAKLRQRAVNLVVSLSGRDDSAALAALEQAHWDVVNASLLALLGSSEDVDAEVARHGGVALAALEELRKR